MELAAFSELVITASQLHAGTGILETVFSRKTG
jgi:hypothetical protein